MFASHKDTHQDIVTIAALGRSVEEAVAAGVKELTEKNGHHDNLAAGHAPRTDLG